MKQTSSVVLLVFLILGSRDFTGLSYLLDNNCGQSKYTNRISGGINADLNAVPWMAYFHANGKFFCGGSLVNHWFVLTAAHCFKQNDFTIYVRLGENDASQFFDCDEFECAPLHSEFWVVKKFLYPYFKTAHYYDVALVKLNQFVKYSKNIQPVCVILDWRWQGYVDSIQNLMVTGWGAKYITEKSDKLQLAKLPQVDRLTCRSRFGYNVDRTHICAGDGGHYVGKGDSGGPLGAMVNFGLYRAFVQFGIVSHLRHPFYGVSVFTNVLSYANWINHTIVTNKSF
ncbi:serine protease grass-like [Drosophila elegans]|uniref:serine protease grass-like n=1 Tax=Drosophila elegans TaxID=30023 RepID=UPI0007E684D1|nr:serine protease grass-like [Drosophila elegans]